MTNQKEWRWFGHAGHFVCARWCQFHLCTDVGGYLVSTIGEYVPDEPVREIIANSRGVKLQGKGDYRLADYMEKIGFEKLGATGLYETMVFKLGGGVCNQPDCNCGLPSPESWTELDGTRYDTAGDATAGHMQFCAKWADAPVEVPQC